MRRYCVAYLDRVHIGFTALPMHDDLRLSVAAFGFGTGTWDPLLIAHHRASPVVTGFLNAVLPIFAVIGKVLAALVLVNVGTDGFAGPTIIGFIRERSGGFEGVLLSVATALGVSTVLELILTWARAKRPLVAQSSEARDARIYHCFHPGRWYRSRGH